jgi:UDP-N-acetylglucosamine:LPS N-acetylglucosamine transferase
MQMKSQRDSGAPLCVCVVGLGGGGFHWEAQRIIQAAQRPLELVLVYGGPNGGIVYWHSDDQVRSRYVLRSPTLTGDSRLGSLLRTIQTAWKAVGILRKERPDVILAVGTSQAVPFALAARLLGRALWYVESITRVRTPSRSGLLLSRLRLATRLYYFSRELRSHYPGGICVDAGAGEP